MNRQVTWIVIIIALAIVITILSFTGCPGKSGIPNSGNGDEQANGRGVDFTLFVPEDPQLIAENNRGVGLMGQFNFAEAREVFAGLAETHPHWLDMQVNLAIASLNRQEEGDEAEALRILGVVIERDPSHLRAQYCSGLLKLYLESSEEAIAHFRLVAEADASDAYAAYYVGQCLFQKRDYEGARLWYEKALGLDNFLRSAYYALAQACQRSDQSDRARLLLDQFQTLKNNPRSRLIEFKYTRMGPKSEVLAINLVKPQPRETPTGSIFTGASELLDDGDSYTWNDEDGGRPASITACDINGDDLIDVFIADALRHGDDVNNAVLINQGDGSFHLDNEHILATVSSVNAALWGDFDNDGLTDVYLLRNGPNQLWRQVEPNVWRDVTETTRTDGGGYDSVDGAMFDADHDGDLDIFCVNADGPNELLNNNLDGTFRSIAQDQHLAGDGRPSRQVIVTDLDRDRDVDIIVINQQPPHEAYINDRGWQYRIAEGMDDFLQADIQAAVAIDVDADGIVELYSLDTQGTVTRWKGERNQPWIGMSMHPANQVSTPRRYQLASADINGDGVSNLISSTQSSWQVVSYQVKPGFHQPYEPGEADIALRGWTVVNLNSTGGPAILGLPVSGGPVIWNAGGGRHGYLSLTFSGREDKGDAMRSNASGIGTHIAARIDSTWTVRDTFRAASGPGQSLQPLAIGTQGFDALEYISIDWSDGVLQTELHQQEYPIGDQMTRVRDLSAGHLERIEEIQRLKSSCPVLFAWNGEKYEFVSDLLGVGGIGYLVAPGEYSPPRPWENIMLPDGLLAAKDGKYVLKLGEPMEEACYIDAAHLVAYDLPPGWQMTLDERMGILGPEPTGEARFYRKIVAPARVVNDRQEDVTDKLEQADLIAAPVGEVDRRFIGRLMTNHVLTLTFDEPLDLLPGAGAMLIADGWIEYPYSQTMFAAWQAQADYLAPTIEARGADGEWQVVLEQFGYPAGMPRQMSVPLANLPAGTTELRISTNLEIYWDRLVVAYAEDCPEIIKVELPLSSARVLRSGFARMTWGPQRQPYYDYEDRAPFWDTRTQTGLYTAFGPVDELVSKADDALAIIGPGEEVHLEFAVPFQTLPPGWTRVFVLETAGWCKDMDFYTQDGETVGPLPTSGKNAANRDRLHQIFNTRLEAGE
ncbi:MAG: VCBS repeat-containing protein [Planctomycetes bacterium]|nr:VCBS repeat-containing protein [Planctomycetota bacterium]